MGPCTGAHEDHQREAGVAGSWSAPIGANNHVDVAGSRSTKDANFRLMLVIHAISDENQVVRITQKSREAVYSRVQDGYAGCRWGYGYDGMREQRDTPYAAGHRAGQGTKLVIVESQAFMVRRIMEEFADGESVWSIHRRLNEDGVPGARGGRWSVDAVRHILHYELYVGVYVYNATKRKRDRETGRVTKEPRPTNEHYRIPAPHLRIVDDGLWNQVQARLRLLSEKQNARRQGGYNRAKNAVYLYSGLLFCGSCDSRMRIGGVQERSYYECPKHRRDGRDCANHLRLPEKVAAEQITAALRDKLLAPETMDWLVDSVFREVNKLIDEQGSSGAGRIRERYRNEGEVGEALQAGLAAEGIAREDIFVTTKLWNTNHRPERVEQAFKASLNRLRLNFLDLYLIHTPFAFQLGEEQDPRDQNGNVVYDDGVTLLDTWRAMESLVDHGRCRAIGLSDITLSGLFLFMNQRESNRR